MATNQQLSVVYRSIKALRPYQRNARIHSKRQIRQIADSIKHFGFTNPVLIDGGETIIAGHGRFEAAKLLSLSEVPTIALDELTEDQIRAYILADNKLAENAGWDKSILAIELQHLLKIETEFDITATGFEIPEIDLILEDEINPDEDETDPDDELPAAAKEAISQPGDLWQLSKHRILCGSSLEDNSYETLMAGKRAAMVLSDPPFNVEIEGNVSGKGVVKHGNFAMASGEMTEAEFTDFLTTSLSLLAKHSNSGSVHFIFMDWRHMKELLAAGERAYSVLLNLCVWCKDNGGQGSFYRSQHELVMVFRNGKDRNRNNIQLGKFGRYRTNVWTYPAVRGLSTQQGDEGKLLELHPTVKPVAMLADAMLDCSARGEIILDGFLGSGSTLIAAERVGRVCYGIELDPLYVDTAIRRWQRHTGDHAIHAASGKRFDDVANGCIEAKRG